MLLDLQLLRVARMNGCHISTKRLSRRTGTMCVLERLLGLDLVNIKLQIQDSCNILYSSVTYKLQLTVKRRQEKIISAVFSIFVFIYVNKMNSIGYYCTILNKCIDYYTVYANKLAIAVALLYSAAETTITTITTTSSTTTPNTTSSATTSTTTSSTTVASRPAHFRRLTRPGPPPVPAPPAGYHCCYC